MKNLKISLVLAIATFFIGINTAIADEIIVNNHGESFVLEESNIDSRNMSDKVSEPFTPNILRAFEKQDGVELPEDIGVPRTADGFDYTESDSVYLEEFNEYSRAATNNRYRVSNPNVFPYRASVLVIVDFKMSNGTMVRGHGSGSLVGSNKVVTAAHVLYDKDLGWAQTVRVYPAVKNNYTDYDMAYGSTLYTYAGYISSTPLSVSAQQRDVAIIKLNYNLGNTTGWYGYTTGSSSYLRLNGYDGDIDDGRTLVTRAGYTSGVTNKILRYPWVTSGGSSGGGLYNPSTNMVEAIHAYSYSLNGVQQEGGGPKINSSIFDFISKY